MPLLFVSAFLYWSVALGLGGLSLMAASAITGGAEDGADAPSAIEPVPGHALAEPIVVHLEESAEPRTSRITRAPRRRSTPSTAATTTARAASRAATSPRGAPSGGTDLRLRQKMY